MLASDRRYVDGIFHRHPLLNSLAVHAMLPGACAEIAGPRANEIMQRYHRDQLIAERLISFECI